MPVWPLTLILAVALLTSCSPAYLWSIHTGSTPRPAEHDIAVLSQETVAILGPLGRSGLHGIGLFLSRPLGEALMEADPRIRVLPVEKALNALNAQGLASEYGDLLSEFDRSGILGRERLGRIGAALGARYVLLPGLAELHEALVDKFDVFGFKLVRNRVVTLRLWLELWDVPTGRLLWRSTGEATVVTELLSSAQSTPLEAIVGRLWRRMLHDNL
jgi:hypothetical protein